MVAMITPMKDPKLSPYYDKLIDPDNNDWVFWNL